MTKITLETIKNTEGVNGINVWEKGSVKRHYINIGQAATKVWWEENEKTLYSGIKRKK